MAPWPLALLATGAHGGRLADLLAFLVCFIGHQLLLYTIGRWTVELDGWRALLTTGMGVAGLSMGSVLLPGWAAPLMAVAASFVVRHYLYDLEWWQNGVMAAGWYTFGAASLLLAGALFAEPEPLPPPKDAPTREELLEALRRETPPGEQTPPEGPPPEQRDAPPEG